MQLVLHCYTAGLDDPISKLYINKKNQPYICPMLRLRFALQGTGIEKPDYIPS